MKIPPVEIKFYPHDVKKLEAVLDDVLAKVTAIVEGLEKANRLAVGLDTVAVDEKDPLL